MNTKKNICIEPKAEVVLNDNLKRRFFMLMDPLVSWEKHENPQDAIFDLGLIYVEDNYKYPNSVYIEAWISNTNSWVDRILDDMDKNPGRYPFFEDLFDIFTLDRSNEAYGTRLTKWIPLRPGEDIYLVLKALKKECEQRYPNTEIKFPKMEERSYQDKGTGCLVPITILVALAGLIVILNLISEYM